MSSDGGQRSLNFWTGVSLIIEVDNYPEKGTEDSDQGGCWLWFPDFGLSTILWLILEVETSGFSISPSYIEINLMERGEYDLGHSASSHDLAPNPSSRGKSTSFLP